MDLDLLTIGDVFAPVHGGFTRYRLTKIVGLDAHPDSPVLLTRRTWLTFWADDLVGPGQPMDVRLLTMARHPWRTTGQPQGLELSVHWGSSAGRAGAGSISTLTRIEVLLRPQPPTIWERLVAEESV